jgi:8-oxo-dGTP diphosphatase
MGLKTAFENHIIVTAGVFYETKPVAKVYLFRKSNTLQYEFPGGKLKSSESETDCLKRELMEELQVLVDIQTYVGQVELKHNDQCYLIKAYLVQGSKNWKLNEHDRVSCVSESEFDALPICDADRRLMPQVWKSLK